MGSVMDLTGHRFGRLFVLGFGGYSPRKDARGRRAQWLCACDCGAQVNVLAQSLRRGATVSCGCKQRANVRTHGMFGSPTYTSWQAAKGRCHNPNDEHFPNYGGAGLVMCERWRSSFAAFLADMGERPAGTTLDRIDNERGYEPGNCRWASPKLQVLNRRTWQHECVMCSASFISKRRTSAFYCSDRCKYRAYKGRLRAARMAA